MSKVILTYDDGLSEDLAVGVGYSFDLLEEGKDCYGNYFLIDFNGNHAKIDRGNFTAYGTYKGKECLVTIFQDNDECVIIQDDEEFTVKRKDVIL